MTEGKNPTGCFSSRSHGSRRVKVTLISSQFCPLHTAARNLLKLITNVVEDAEVEEVPLHSVKGLKLCKRYNISLIPSFIVENGECTILIEGVIDKEELLKVLKRVQGGESLSLIHI